MAENRLELGARDVEVTNLTVRYGDVVALQRLSFRVERGRVLAIVGANGAGKSTLFRALLGLVPVAEGEARLLGRSATSLGQDHRSRIAFVSERHAELEHLRVHELARFRAEVYPRFDAASFTALARELDLPLGAAFGELSRGQRAAVVVSLALAQRPDLLLLDDPTLGLDPLARRRIVQAVLGASRERAITIVVATHELADVERIADDLVLLTRGHGSAAMALESFVADACSVEVPRTTPIEAIHALEGVLHVWPRRGDHQVVIRGDEMARARAARALAKLSRVELTPRSVTFEEVALAWLATKEAS